jgi:hypothetical protein
LTVDHSLREPRCMTDIRTLEDDDGLEAIRADLKYSERRLSRREATRSYAAAFTTLLGRWSALRDAQLARWDAEDDADVAVADADDDLDDAITAVDKALLAHLAGKEHPQYVRYFGDDTVKGVQRLGLETQIARVEGWSASLRTMGDAPARAADALDAAITAGRAALAARVAAAAARADHRSRDVQSFVDDANALRRSTYGALVAHAAQNGLGTSWPNRFFRRGKRRRRSNDLT